MNLNILKFYRSMEKEKENQVKSDLETQTNLENKIS